MRQCLQHIADRPGRVFFRPVGVGTGHRRIVGAKHRDGQCRRVVVAPSVTV